MLWDKKWLANDPTSVRRRKESVATRCGHGGKLRATHSALFHLLKDVFALGLSRNGNALLVFATPELQRDLVILDASRRSSNRVGNNYIPVLVHEAPMEERKLGHRWHMVVAYAEGVGCKRPILDDVAAHTLDRLDAGSSRGPCRAVVDSYTVAGLEEGKLGWRPQWMDL